MTATPTSRNAGPSRHHERTPLRHGSLKDAGISYHGKYRATTLWNNIVRQFREEMPTKRHRRQLTSFDDSFTGKEAVDFLMILLPRLIFEGRQVDRSNCVTLLQKFLDQGFIARVRSNPSEKGVFKDNAALYIFADDGELFGISHTPRLVRSNSYAQESHRPTHDLAKLPPMQHPRSPDEYHYLRIPTPSAKKGFNRRMSSSHGNLLALLPESKTDFNSADSLAETIDSRRVEVNFNMRPSPVREYNTPVANNMRGNNKESRKKVSLTEKKKSPCVTKTPDVSSSKQEEIEKEGAYEWLNFVRRKKPLGEQHNKPPKPPSASRVSKPRRNDEGEPVELIEHRKRVSSGAVKPQEPDPVYCPIQITHRYVTEIDVWSIWKNCLLSRLNRLLSLTSLPFITWPIDGQDVKWNCLRVGTSGVVKSRADREEFSGYLLRLMRYLEQFPFPSGSANIITYKDNQEVNVFRTVCSHLAREAPMLLNEEAYALIHIISLFHEKELMSESRSSHQPCGREVHIETEFTENLPRSRIVPRPLSNTMTHYVSVSSTNSSRSSVADNMEHLPNVRKDRPHLQAPLGKGLMRPEFGTSMASLPPAKSFGQERHNTYLLEGLPEYEEILRLPGLKRSPELMKRLDEMCLKPKSQLVCQTSSESIKLPDFNEVGYGEVRQCAGSASCQSTGYNCSITSGTMTPIDEELLPKPSETLLEALSLVLLSLPSSRRRKLHYLVRFMNKIAANHCLQLDELHSNRAAVLKGLSRSIVSLRGSPEVTAPQRAYLVNLLLDHEKKIFGVPRGLVAEVEDAIRERQREKLMPKEEGAEKLSSVSGNTVQFCDQIKTCEYDEQNQQLNQNLLELLEQICCDENLSVNEKRKRLKKFKKTYPAVYSQRFPSPELTQPKRKEREHGLFSKLFGR